MVAIGEMRIGKYSTGIKQIEVAGRQEDIVHNGICQSQRTTVFDAGVGTRKGDRETTIKDDQVRVSGMVEKNSAPTSGADGGMSGGLVTVKRVSITVGERGMQRMRKGKFLVGPCPGIEIPEEEDRSMGGRG